MKKIFLFVLLGISQLCMAQNVNGTFESWRNYSVATAPATTLQLPYGWFAADSIIFYANGLFPSATFHQQVFKTTSAHAGSYAARLVTTYQDTFHVLPALLTNASVNLDFAAFDPSSPMSGLVMSGGTAITSRVAQVNAWVKYFPVSGDAATVFALAIRQGAGTGGTDSVVGSGNYMLTDTLSTYQAITVPIIYADSITAPDILRVIVTSSGNYSHHAGSTVYIDDVTAQTTSSIIPLFKAPAAVYPNPANTYIYASGTTVKHMNIYDAAGRLLLTSGPVANVADLAHGTYLVELVDENGMILGIDKLEKQ